jgi:acyl-[acyl-carrier-protein] desaturase
MKHSNQLMQDHLELLHTMQDYVKENLSLLAPIDKAWQPTDYLPDLGSDGWREQVELFRTASQVLSDELLVVLVGDMVTEEALPNYAISLNLIAQENTGDAKLPWSQWLRGWTAEENRHGDLLNAYLRLTGRVDMRSVELTIHHLITGGFNPKSFPDPYNGIVYTSFQERATRISHANVGKLVAAQGDNQLAKICQRISGDESRHELFYTRMMGKVFDLDPNGAMLSFRSMMRTVIAMPGKLMFDGKDPDLFDHFAVIAQRTGVYTVYDYASIIEHLVKTWDIAGRIVTGPAAKAQEYLCRQAERYKTFADEMAARFEEHPPIGFSWIQDRKV